MSTGYGWEGIRQVCATLLGARHVPERLRGGSVFTWGARQVFDLYLYRFYLFYITGLHDPVVYGLKCGLLGLRKPAANIITMQYKKKYEKNEFQTKKYQQKWIFCAGSDLGRIG